MIVKQRDDTAIIHLNGALTHSAFDSFNALLDTLSVSDVRYCVLDMSNVDFIDSGGIGMLLLGQEVAEQRECEYRLRSVRPAALSILEQAHVRELFAFEANPRCQADEAEPAAA